MWSQIISVLPCSSEAFPRHVRAAGSLFALHRSLERSVRLPLRSTSIKFVAPWLGFAWANPEADAAWSTAQLHRAYETDDLAERARILPQVATYNADGLWAMRGVWRWLAGHSGRPLQP